ncbi:hypothetical protein FGO68_gene10917 [Halteria grandinella]|uniref:Uncharacterized protein n=1 Tax=Halteria grandinella TaxID=5974 RepID=A0A8J8NDQ3_HALGN|nr:hypothetical protein FGO68_gene10917 [Halteria grandinella]
MFEYQKSSTHNSYYNNPFSSSFLCQIQPGQMRIQISSNLCFLIRTKSRSLEKVYYWWYIRPPELAQLLEPTFRAKLLLILKLSEFYWNLKVRRLVIEILIIRIYYQQPVAIINIYNLGKQSNFLIIETLNIIIIVLNY